MTNERAVELLNDVTVLDDPEMEEAHKMAISALQQQEQELNEPMTNADRIRAMSGEELAKFLAETSGDKVGGMAKFWMEWLRQPAKEDDHANL